MHGKMTVAVFVMSLVACATCVSQDTPTRQPSEGENLALGKLCSFDPPVNYSYCTDPDDPTQLTDGIYNGCEWVDEGTVGWAVRREPVHLIDIDLGQAHAIGKITFDTITGGAQVTFPSAALVFVSTDGEQYRYLCDVLTESLPQDKSLNHRFVADGLKGWGRYVRIAVISGGFYIFCDEIEVIKGDLSAAEAAFLDDVLIPAAEVRQYAAGKIPWVTQKNATLTLLRAAANAVAARAEAIGDNAPVAQARAAIERERRAVLAAAEVQEADYQEGPPYRDHDRRAFVEIARLNAKLWPGKDVVVWQSSPWEWLRPLDGPVGRPLGASVSVDMMGNEFATATFTVTSASAEPMELSLSVADLVGPETVPADELVTLAHVVHVEAFGYNYRDDAIVPLTEGPVVLQPGVSKRIWLTFSTRGKDPQPGTYTSQVTVAGGDAELAKVPIKLRVWPLRFPDDVSLHSNTWGYFDEAPLVGNEDAAARDLLDHYNTALTINHRYLPKPKPDAEGNLTEPLDFSKLDQMIEWNPECRLWLIWPGFEFGLGRLGTSGIGTPVWEKVFTEYVTQMRDHLAEKGISTDEFAWYWVDEPGAKSWDEKCVPPSKLVKQIDPNMLVWSDPTSGVTHEQLEAGLAYTDIYCPSGSHVSDPTVLDICHRTNLKSWVYVCASEKNAPPFGYYRWFAWRAWKLGLGGIGMWVYVDANGMTLSDYTSGVSYGLVFRGRDGLIGSKRWDAWRQGIADYEYLRMLRDAADVAEAAGRNEEAVARAEAILGAGVDEVVGDSIHGGPADKADLPDELRLRILQCLVDLGED